jgi:hypothetical protein
MVHNWELKPISAKRIENALKSLGNPVSAAIRGFGHLWRYRDTIVEERGLGFPNEYRQTRL